MFVDMWYSYRSTRHTPLNMSLNNDFKNMTDVLAVAINHYENSWTRFRTASHISF